jgi:hypothetical protein
MHFNTPTAAPRIVNVIIAVVDKSGRKSHPEFQMTISRK